ncbi:kinase-like protein [Basidiobolus meristosporus CBS 931.73]|uniref:non-specific serine/threonine protein kinase n=1 Tax=Basidiobolus meristosporus CBS 931.73 TaxID=1314790 RepID=A0A1Y1XKS8_9FUNG|nr:kinase-like protein [Basidiobolus meristosporus CBS 931.73]|eukprot:ORX86315.1 kinase-like protein [Basidiobolus meristosporus CBS 931.73]
MLPSISPNETAFEHDDDPTLYKHEPLASSMKNFSKSNPPSLFTNAEEIKTPDECCIEKRSIVAKRLLLTLKKMLKKHKKEERKSGDLLSAIVKQNNGSIEGRYGSFIEEKRSGSGGMVRITCCCDSGKKYAVKTFRECQKEEPVHKYLQWINNEITVSRRLNHSYIIQTHEVLKENEKIHSVMEYCPCDLYQLVEEGKVSQQLAAKYFAQVVHAIAYMHSCGIAHRDIKLENICIDEKGSIKLIDYGCAFIFQSSPQHKPRVATTLCGSQAYIAPELHTREPYDPCKADVWSIAVVYLTLILRSFPWSVANPYDPGFKMFLKHQNNAKYFNRIPEPAVPIIRRMLDPNPNTRASIQDVLGDPWVKSIALE